MLLKTVVDTKSQKVLIIAREETLFVRMLKKKLHEMHVDIVMSPVLAESLETFDVCFFVQFSEVLLPSLKAIEGTTFVFVFFEEDETAQMYASFAYKEKLHHIKILNLETFPEFYEKDLETIFWFSFSRTEDVFLHIFHQARTSAHITKKKRSKKRSWKERLTPKSLILAGFFILFITQFLFLIPLSISTWNHYAAYRGLEEHGSSNVTRNITTGRSSIESAARLYEFSKPVLNFFSIALPFDNLIQINTSASRILTTSQQLKEDAHTISAGLFEKDKSEEDIARVVAAKERLIARIPELRKDISTLASKLPAWTDNLKKTKEKLTQMDQALRLVETVGPHFDVLFARGTEKRYLLLFANNMELRPGGGFIGSYAIMKVADYTVQDIQVFDVYDADGQLTTRIEPPTPISEYLNQPFWYLRDSAFTGDFPQDFVQAETFLGIEMNEAPFDGGLLITTSGVKYLLSALDSLYIPDFQETITADNFYLKAQLHAESEFFPGSTQKKSFLGNVFDQIIFALPDSDPQKILDKTKDALDQKQLVLYSRDAQIQALFEEQFWAGSKLEPTCTVPTAPNCIADYLYSLDANLGVNKANFFIQRPTDLNVHIDEKGTITNTLKVRYINDSHEGVFPGGTYKNYAQILLPPNAQIQSVKVDGVAVSPLDETNFTYKTVGFYLEIEPQQTREVRVTYRLPTTIVNGAGLYQLILQKQIGSPNYDFSFTIGLPSNMRITRHNLSPLAEGNEILYNTSVSSDKIFLIEYSKN